MARAARTSGRNLEVLAKIKTDGKCTPGHAFHLHRQYHAPASGSSCRPISTTASTTCSPCGATCPMAGPAPSGDLHYATELVKFVRKEFGDKFTIAVAGSPEGHIQCRSPGGGHCIFEAEAG